MNRSLIGLLAALIAIAAIVAGCGSSSSSETGTESESTASITKAEFVKKGNVICEEGNEEIEEGFEEFAKEKNLSEKNPPSEGESKEAAENILIPAVDKQVEGLRGLGTPEGDEGEVDAILSAAEEAVEESEEDPVALIEGEGNAFKKANGLARKYGLTACGEEG